MRVGQRQRRGGARVQRLRHRRRRHGLQGHAHAQEEARQESRGGELHDLEI